jgi:N-acetylmuramoyl-L-alanine amidase
MGKSKLGGAQEGLLRRRGRALLAGLVAVLGLAAVAASHAATSSAGLLGVRLGGDALQTRIVLDLDQAATGKVVSDGSSDGRLVLVLPGVSAEAGLQGNGTGLIKTWVVDRANGGARLQMDLAAGSRIKRRFLLPPADGVDYYRYVVDVAAAPEVKFTKAAVPLKLKPQQVAERAAPVRKKVVVIDAGHGGNDPGARGAYGFEKDVNLAAARALKARLEREGRYRVVMTRDSDLYVPLESRVRIAQRAGADLFISLHSDSGPQSDLRGASVYTLSEKASTRSAKFVSREDWFRKASLAGDPGVSDILFDLTQRATKNRSSAFAQTLVAHIEGHAPMLRRSHRDAGFVVLLAPDVPAVLLEMGFLSNVEDEQLLRDPQRLGRLMDGVSDAIGDYFGETTRLASR